MRQKIVKIKTMRLEYYSSEKLKKEILGIISRHLDLKEYKVFFFGSRVTGKGSERSDIDLGIKGPQPVKASLLWAIEEEIESLPTLYKIEVIDFKGVSPKFAKVAEQNIELLN